MCRVLVCLPVLLALTGAQSPNPPEMKVRVVRGIIARISANTGLVVVKIGDDKNFKQETFQVDKVTKYFGADGGPLYEGLSHSGFKVGAEVWFVVPASLQSRTILDFRLVGPAPPTTTIRH